MFPERLERGPARHAVAAQIVGDLGHNRLSAVRGSKKTSYLVERTAEIVAATNFRGPRMQRHPDANRRLFRPPLGTERALRSERSLDCAWRGGKGGAERIARGLEDVPAARLD